MVIAPDYVGIISANNHRNLWPYAVHRLLAEVKKPGKSSGSNISVVLALFHLFVAALHRICTRLGRIFQNFCIKELCIAGPLTQREHDPYPLTMELADFSFQDRTMRGRVATSAIAHAHPWDTVKRCLCISYNSQHLGRRYRRRIGRCPCNCSYCGWSADRKSRKGLTGGTRRLVGSNQ